MREPATSNQISSLILCNALATSEEEAEALASCIMEEMGTLSEHEQTSRLWVLLQDYFSLSEPEVKRMFPLFEGNSKDADVKDGCNIQDELVYNDQVWENLSNEDEEMMIGEGECELCERSIRLTKHHLIPKSTWKRIAPQLLHAAKAFQKGNSERAQQILEDYGLWHLEPDLRLAGENYQKSLKQLLQHQTCNICRPCHSTVHSTHDNIVLATQYNTVEKLSQDDSIYRFCKWANKQRAGKHAR